jgi:hypothetical protein
MSIWNVFISSSTNGKVTALLKLITATIRNEYKQKMLRTSVQNLCGGQTLMENVRRH